MIGVGGGDWSMLAERPIRAGSGRGLGSVRFSLMPIGSIPIHCPRPLTIPHQPLATPLAPPTYPKLLFHWLCSHLLSSLPHRRPQPIGSPFLYPHPLTQSSFPIGSAPIHCPRPLRIALTFPPAPPTQPKLLSHWLSTHPLSMPPHHSSLPIGSPFLHPHPLTQSSFPIGSAPIHCPVPLTIAPCPLAPPSSSPAP